MTEQPPYVIPPIGDSAMVEIAANGTVETLTVAEIKAKLVALRADRDEWDRLADTHRNYWQLQDEIETYEWLAGEGHA